MTDPDLPTPSSDSEDIAPDPPDQVDIDKLFPMLPDSEVSPLDDMDEDTEEPEAVESFEAASPDEAEEPAQPLQQGGDTNDTEPSEESEADSDEIEAGEDSDDDSGEKSQAEPTGPTIIVRYGVMGYLGEFRHKLKRRVRAGDKVVVRTDRGVELGEVVSRLDRSDTGQACEGGSPGSCITSDTLNRFLKNSSENYPFRRGGRVLRIANQQDLIDFRHLNSSASEESRYCREQIQQRKLPMHLVKAEHMLGGERIVFYFTAESRVDFRSLVRDLASQFRTRIEMRQVGARDEARLVADYERCGRPCCCREFLKDLKPVSMRMAKVQKATLDPTKISGRCGRLMCCLRYEDECYEELKKSLPRRNSWVKTKTHIGRVVDGQIITQLVRLALYDGTFVVVPVEDILERNIEPPSEDELRDHAVRVAAAQRNEARKAAEAEAAAFAAAMAENKPLELDVEESASADSTPRDGEESQNAPKKKRRRRRRKKPSGDANNEQKKNTSGNRQRSSQPKDKGQNAQAANSDGPKKSSRRRRGRRRKKPGQGNQGGGQNQNQNKN